MRRPRLGLHDTLLGQAQEQGMQVQGSTEVQHNVRKRLLQHVQLTRHVVFCVRGSKEQAGTTTIRREPAAILALHGLCQGRAANSR